MNPTFRLTPAAFAYAVGYGIIGGILVVTCAYDLTACAVVCFLSAGAMVSVLWETAVRRVRD